MHTNTVLVQYRESTNTAHRESADHVPVSELIMIMIASAAVL